MAEPTTPIERQNRDWRLRFSLGITLLWLVLGLLYLSSVVGWGRFLSEGAPSVGGFLEGAFAPLAFLWLVVGFFLQQQQLSENTETIRAQLVEMRRTAEHAETQARAIQADELHSRQDTFTRVVALVNEQLGTLSGYILTSWASTPEQLGEMVGLWAKLGEGDPGVFSRKATEFIFRGLVEPAELFWGTEIRAGHSEKFVETFERLIRHAASCDPDGMIADAVRDGSHGRYYRFMTESRPA